MLDDIHTPLGAKLKKQLNWNLTYQFSCFL